ncbi:hypothetical protein CCACVL1_23881, partial [Corchorus capsularis]
MAAAPSKKPQACPNRRRVAAASAEAPRWIPKRGKVLKRILKLVFLLSCLCCNNIPTSKTSHSM